MSCLRGPLRAGEGGLRRASSCWFLAPVMAPTITLLVVAADFARIIRVMRDGVRSHEVTFCGKVKSWAEQIFRDRPSLPFGSAEVEQSPSGSRQRQDLCFYDREHRPALSGEVKLPGTPEGRNPYDERLLEDASKKAQAGRFPYFFTWNVNRFVLFDRSRWNVPLPEQRVKPYDLELHLTRPEDVFRGDVESRIRDRFLPAFFEDFATILRGEKPGPLIPPDDLFIRSLETHLDWPVHLTRDYLSTESERDRAFDAKLQSWMADELQWTFRRGDPEDWAHALERASQTLAYVLVNRMIFYEAVRARFKNLPELSLPPRSPEKAVARLSHLFQKAVDATGDYEPLFYPQVGNWTHELVFRGEGSLDAWHGVIKAIHRYDLKDLNVDVIGRVFQRLISPEERHKFGQHYTNERIVDVINAFCIRSGDASVLDPACGSGTFLVRAYYRKRWLAARAGHARLLEDLHGCDLSLFAAHLATLNLAARDIREEANYPRIRRTNFFEVDASDFCRLPGRGSVPLPPLDAVVANPPYVRQEHIPKKSEGAAPGQTKEFLQELLRRIRPRVALSGRSDLHCYFWPAAARFLKQDGHFGFLTSSSWLDVEYGFALQRWALGNFRILAVLESVEEPWFEDARVKTCVTIMRRCDDEAARRDNLVRFARTKKALAGILVGDGSEDEDTRQVESERFRDLIERTTTDYADENVRIVVKRQDDLWKEGLDPSTHEYVGGKWGRYLRAPDLYFQVMREFGRRFVRLGQIAVIRFGVKSGCDAFFMPFDVTHAALKKRTDPGEFKRHHGCDRKDVAAGRIRVVRAGDGSVHSIEAQFVKPELHSPMEVDRPVVRAMDLQRIILLVGKPKSALTGTWVAKYLRYGETNPFESKKSKPVPVPKRSTCASREVWYDLTNEVKPGIAFWPMAQQYRHIFPENPAKIICNHRFFDIDCRGDKTFDPTVLVAVLNSTLVALFKTFYGRFTGTEGSLDTEVIDVEMMEVPNPTGVDDRVARKIKDAFGSLRTREIGPMVELAFMECRSPERIREMAGRPLDLPKELTEPDRRALDDAVFEMLGVEDAGRRHDLVVELYRETALHFRQIRIVEVQKQEQRKKGEATRFSPTELAGDIWDAVDRDLKVPLLEWLAARPGPLERRVLSDGPASLPDANDMFHPHSVFFGKKGGVHMELPSREHAEIVARLSWLGLTGSVPCPVTPPPAAASCWPSLKPGCVARERGSLSLPPAARARTG